MNAITDNPNVSKFNFRAKGIWINGDIIKLQLTTLGMSNPYSKSTLVSEKDEPPVLLGA